MLKYQQEALQSFGGGLGEIKGQPKLSKLEQEIKILKKSDKNLSNIGKKRKLMESDEPFAGSLDDVFKKVSPKSTLPLMNYFVNFEILEIQTFGKRSKTSEINSLVRPYN